MQRRGCDLRLGLQTGDTRLLFKTTRKAVWVVFKLRELAGVA